MGYRRDTFCVKRIYQATSPEYSFQNSGLVAFTFMAGTIIVAAGNYDYIQKFLSII